MNPSAPAATQMIMAGGIAAASLVATMVLVDPVPQPPAYHLFADTRQIAGIPNALNTLTNVPFLLVGAYGMALCFKVKAPAAWLLLFISVAFVSAGSAWYHLAPTMASLVWDRLPMAVGFMGLFVALLSEYVDNRLRQLLLPAAALGAGSVLYWAATDDLRLYGWVQFVPLVAIPVVLALYPARYTHGRWLLAALGAYGLAKVCEYFDLALLAATGSVLSGHSLKHLLAAVCCLLLAEMIRRRSAARGAPASIGA